MSIGRSNMAPLSRVNVILINHIKRVGFPRFSHSLDKEKNRWRFGMMKNQKAN
jgi:hypothetical protein